MSDRTLLDGIGDQIYFNGRPIAYILASGKPPEEQDEIVPASARMWSEWHEDITKRRIAYTTLNDVAHVSTVFLGTYTNMEGPPRLWETMAFNMPDCDRRQQRYANRPDALAGHQEIVDECRAILARVERGEVVPSICEEDA